MPRLSPLPGPTQVCPELLDGRRVRGNLALERYDRLHLDGRRLIRSWLQRAWAQRECAPEDTFEPFVFAWISFNGWAACITEMDRDREWLDALLVNSEIAEKFAQLKLGRAEGSPVSDHVRAFGELWPIFRAQEIRRRGIYRRNEDERTAVVQQYLDAHLTEYQPKCWRRHADAGERVPVDWPHTLEALYRVRCNLFHGEKAPHSEMDQRIVSTAFRVLVHFLHQSGYIFA